MLRNGAGSSRDLCHPIFMELKVVEASLLLNILHSHQPLSQVLEPSYITLNHPVSAQVPFKVLAFQACIVFLHANSEVDIRRNIVCEPCEKVVTGGYDSELNQVVVCQNNARSSGVVQGILAHELLHMFDQCRAKMDLKNIDHLACTEVRKS